MIDQEKAAPVRNHMMPDEWYQGLDKGIRFAVRVLHAAGIADTCQSCEGGPGHAYEVQKPGELDKFEIERKAQAAAEDAAVGAIVAKAVKKAPDAKFWRFLAGLVLHAIHTDVDDAMKRRDIEAEKGDGFEALLKWVADQKEEGALRGLVVELLIGDYAFNGADDSGNVAARFYGVDVDALRAEAKTQIKAEAKEKAKTAAAKASKKTAKASAPSKPSAQAQALPQTRIWPGKGLAALAAEFTPPVLEEEPLERDEARRVSGRKGAPKEVLVFGEAQRTAAPPVPPTGEPPCTVCGCTETTACSDGEGGWCSWTAPGLCSVCADCQKEALFICRKAQSATAVDKALAKRWPDASRRAAVEQLVTSGKLRREGVKLVVPTP